MYPDAKKLNKDKKNKFASQMWLDLNPNNQGGTGVNKEDLSKLELQTSSVAMPPKK